MTVGCTVSYFVKIIWYSRWFCNPLPIIWGSALLHLRSPKGGCRSISDDVLSFYVLRKLICELSVIIIMNDRTEKWIVLTRFDSWYVKSLFAFLFCRQWTAAYRSITVTDWRITDCSQLVTAYCCILAESFWRGPISLKNRILFSDLVKPDIEHTSILTKMVCEWSKTGK